MTYEIRCDSPACRRLLEMQIRLLDERGAVEEALPQLRLLEYPDVRLLTHGICEDCLEKMTGELAAIG